MKFYLRIIRDPLNLLEEYFIKLILHTHTHTFLFLNKYFEEFIFLKHYECSLHQNIRGAVLRDYKGKPVLAYV